MEIKNGTLKGASVIQLDTLGIINGCIDLLSQELSYPEFAFNNTYGIKAINQSAYDTSVRDFNRKGGCKDKIVACRKQAAALDPNDWGNNKEVDKVCKDASDYCSNAVEGPYIEYGDRGYYDIAHKNPDPFPPNYFIGFLNQHWVQGALGVPVNYTISVNSVYYAFQSTGDYARGGYLEDMAYILDNGVKIAMVYGDRDYACNCR